MSVLKSGNNVLYLTYLGEVFIALWIVQYQLLSPPKHPSQSTQIFCFHLFLIEDVTSRPTQLTRSTSSSGDTVFSRLNVVWLVYTRVVSICSCSKAKTVGGSRVKVDSLVALPIKTSARSFPRTPACPGEKIHRIHWRLYLFLLLFEILYSLFLLEPTTRFSNISMFLLTGFSQLGLSSLTDLFRLIQCAVRPTSRRWP